MQEVAMNEHPTITALAARFVSRFARFEFALKQLTEFRVGDKSRVEPGWDKFSRSPEIARLFKAVSSDIVIQYLIDNPPMKRGAFAAERLLGRCVRHLRA
jgi:hypothetical protein